MKCLMIETPDKRRYFTHKANYNKIKDFANSFNYRMSFVDLVEGEVIFDLDDLADAISRQQSCKRPKIEAVKRRKKRKT